MIKLYGIPASRAARCLWMLEELDLEYENVPTHFIGDSKKPDYLKLNPNGKLPTLDDDGLVVWESMAINLYLARKYPRPAKRRVSGSCPITDAHLTRQLVSSLVKAKLISQDGASVLVERNLESHAGFSIVVGYGSLHAAYNRVMNEIAQEAIAFVQSPEFEAAYRKTTARSPAPVYGRAW